MVSMECSPVVVILYCICYQVVIDFTPCNALNAMARKGERNGDRWHFSFSSHMKDLVVRDGNREETLGRPSQPEPHIAALALARIARWP